MSRPQIYNAKFKSYQANFNKNKNARQADKNNNDLLNKPLAVVAESKLEASPPATSQPALEIKTISSNYKYSTVDNNMHGQDQITHL